MINAVIILDEYGPQTSELVNKPRNSIENMNVKSSGGRFCDSTSLKFLLSVAVPKPILKIAGHSIIFHHVRALASIV